MTYNNTHEHMIYPNNLFEFVYCSWHWPPNLIGQTSLMARVRESEHSLSNMSMLHDYDYQTSK